MFGYFDTKYIDFSQIVDVNYLQALQNREGVSFVSVLQDLDNRMGQLNSQIDPLVASLIVPTTQIVARNRQVSVFNIEEHTEYTLVRPQVAELTQLAHMLPIRNWEVSLGFTEDALEIATQERINDQIDAILGGFRKLYRRRALQRLFSIKEVAVDKTTNSTSPGFAGSGTGSNVFTGYYPDGTTLPSNYSLYYRDTSANLGPALKTMQVELMKWQDPPFELVSNATQIAAVQALGESGGFVSVGSEWIRGAASTSEALVDPTKYVGVLHGNILVRKPIYDYSDANLALYKSYGNFNQNNPPAWRWDEKAPGGRGAWIRDRGEYPLSNAVVKQRFDIGVNNRTSAALLYVAASGSYTDPTIS